MPAVTALPCPSAAAAAAPTTPSGAPVLPELVTLPSPVAPACEAAGFARSRATVALTGRLRAGLARAGVALSHEDLGRMGWTLHRAWEAACDNLMALAMTRRGLHFRLRPATATAGAHAPAAAVQVASGAGEDTAAWLAHPRAFTALHHHLQRHVSRSLHYVLGRGGLLVAAPSGQADGPALSAWRTGPVLEYADGFPRRATGAPSTM